MIYLKLFWEFFKTGLFSVGGGLATLPFLSKMGDAYGWFTQEDLANMLAVSESTPGPIGVNMATYVGTTVGGYIGGAIATFGLVLPSFLVILIVAKVMQKFKDNRFVQSSMQALRPTSVGMISAAVISVLLSVLFNTGALLAGSWREFFRLTELAVFAVLLGIYIKFNKLHPVVVLLLGAAAGILLKL